VIVSGYLGGVTFVSGERSPMSAYDSVRADDRLYCPECRLPFPAFGVTNILQHLIIWHPYTPLGAELAVHERLLEARRARRAVSQANFIG
jgi:hypothetical protein